MTDLETVEDLEQKIIETNDRKMKEHAEILAKLDKLNEERELLETMADDVPQDIVTRDYIEANEEQMQKLKSIDMKSLMFSKMRNRRSRRKARRSGRKSPRKTKSRQNASRHKFGRKSRKATRKSNKRSRNSFGYIAVPPYMIIRTVQTPPCF
jgi:hypothetical protein